MVIKQWGSQAGGNNTDIYLPIAFNSKLLNAFGWDSGAAAASSMQFVGVNLALSNLKKFHIFTSAAANIGLSWIAIGK